MGGASDLIATAIVNRAKHCFYAGVDGYSRDAYEHNQKIAGPIHLITEESKSWRTMENAACSVYGPSVADGFALGSMSVYLAIREFLESSDSGLIWLEADMCLNPKVQIPTKSGVCLTQAWGNPRYTPTSYEIAKRKFCETFLPNPKREYASIQSSWFKLSRPTLKQIVAGLDSIGLDFLTKKSWELIQATERQLGIESLSFICDMVLEMAWMASEEWEAESVFGTLGWVSYDSDWDSKPIIHFDGPNKSKIANWIEGCAVSDYH